VVRVLGEEVEPAVQPPLAVEQDRVDGGQAAGGEQDATHLVGRAGG
jgi:hypothetical protein